MWNSGGCGSETSGLHQNNNEYTPPEKKQKEFSDNEALHQALQCCKNQEIGIEEASLIYGIPKRTLRAKLKNNNFSTIDEKYKVFVLPVFPAQTESDLVGFLQDLIESQIFFSSTEVRRLGYELVCKKFKLNNVPFEKNCILGQRWYKRLITKYPYLDVENSMTANEQQKSTNFYNTLESFVFKHKLEAANVFFVDGVELKFRASSIDDFKIFHQRKTIYTNAKAICCTSPIGMFVPPVFLKPLENSESGDYFEELGDEKSIVNIKDSLNTAQLGTVCDKLKEMHNSNIKHLPTSEDLANIQKQIKIHLNKKLQPMSDANDEELREKLYEQFSQLKNKIIDKYERTLNEVTHEVFYDWFVKFISYVKPSVKKKVLLLLRDENYIKCFKSLELAKSSGVLFLVIPPHSIHKIHPLDGFAMSLNRNLSTCARRWLVKNPDFKVHQVPLHTLFKKAFSETINPAIAKNGFLYSGIWPINRNIFGSSELGGESLLLQKNHQPMSGIGYLKTGVVNNSKATLLGITSESDLKKLCRICMKEKMYMKPLFDPPPNSMLNYHGKKVSDIIKKPILATDGLPMSICQYCLVQLLDTVKTKGIAVESHIKQLKLRETLNKMSFDEKSNEQELQSILCSDLKQQYQGKIMNKLLSKNSDFNSMCRICMGEKPLMTSIFFKPQSGNNFCAETCRKIMEVSQVQVHIHDGLSTLICPFCRASINQASEFIQRAQSSDKRFREIVAQIKFS